MAPPGRTTAQNGSSFAPGNAPAASSSKTTSLSKSQQGSSSANGIGIHGHAAGDIADGRGQGRDETVEVLYLQPSAYPRNGKGKWKDTGRSLAVTISPINGEVVAYVTPQPGSDANAASKSMARPHVADKALYLTSLHDLPDAVISLYTGTYTLFTSLQRIVASSYQLPTPGHPSKADIVLGPPEAETITHMRRIVAMYLEEVSKVTGAPDLDAENRSRYQAVFHIMHLAQILYLPQDGRGEGLLGEELLDWVNEVDPAPDNSLGNEIMQSRNPWEHPAFWPYIVRCLLRGFHLPAASFLRTLSKHPHESVSRIASIIATHLTLLPRSHNTSAYPLDHQFLTAHRQWQSKFRAELSAVTGGRPKGKWLDAGGKSKYVEVETELQALVDLMQGNQDRILEQAADWREAVGVWGILVKPDMRRDHLPGIMRTVLEKLPVEKGAIDDEAQAALCEAKVVEALMGCHDLDVWLAAHLGDVFDKLDLMPDDEDRFELALRDYFLLDYCDLLQDHPKATALWRIIADYLALSGHEGRNRLKAYIVRVAMDLSDATSPPEDEVEGEDGMDVERDPLGERFSHFTEIREACLELKLDSEWREISRVMADRLVRRGEYGLAATMCLQAEDGYTLSRIAEMIMDAFVDQGEETYLRLVDTLPPTLLNEAPLALKELQLEPGADVPFDLPNQTAVSVFASRLACLAEFRDYLLFLGQGVRDLAAAKIAGLLSSGISPTSFASVLLAESIILLEDQEILFSSQETFELMRVLEEVSSNSRYAAEDYLPRLSRYLRRKSSIASDENGTGRRVEVDRPFDEKAQLDAWNKLEEVRLALARNLARALVVGFDDPL